MSGLFQKLALFVYLLSMASFLVYTFRQNKMAGQAAHWLISIGFVLQTVFLIYRAVDLGQLPVLDLGSALGFFGWTLAGAYLVLYWRFKLLVLGTFVSPPAFVLVLLSMLLANGPMVAGPAYRSLWLTLHLGTVFFGYGFFGLAFLAGVMYLLQEREIKSKRMGAVFRRLPSLNVLDTMNYYCLTLGFPLMTLGIVTGMYYAQITLGHFWRWDPKEVWSGILWLFYAALLHQRLTVGWQGRRAAIMAIIGFSVLCFTFIGVSLVLPGYHSAEGLKALGVK